MKEVRTNLSHALAVIISIAISPTITSAQPIVDLDELRQRVEKRGPIYSLSASGDQNLGSFQVDTTDREESRAFFNAVYMASEDVDIGWTGNYAITNDPVAAAGDTSNKFKEAVLLRVNYYRALAGIPANIIFKENLNADAQLASLIVSGNDRLSHRPILDSFPNYISSNGDAAAGASNIAWRSNGPDSINGYMQDHGSSNARVGHRRWILFPPSKHMGTGDTPSGSAPESVLLAIQSLNGQRPIDDVLPDANALYVIADANFGTNPSTTHPFVAYPPPGYVPYQITWPRWSLSIDAANFANAAVSMTRNGANVPVVIESSTDSGIGYNTIVWRDAAVNANVSNTPERPESDVIYSITVSGIQNAPQSSYTYETIVFDPSVPSADHVPTVISGSANPKTEEINEYSVTIPSFASSIAFRSFDLSVYSETQGAENGEQDLIIDSSEGYDVINPGLSASGSNSFHLAMPNATSQTIQFPQTFLATSSSTLDFKSRLGWATADQVAKVQLSQDGGTSWNDIYSQAGTNSDGESSFQNKSISLADYSGRTFQFRFRFDFSSGGFFPQTDSDTGWSIDDIEIKNVETLSNISTSPTLTGHSFSFTPATTGTFGLQAQAVLFDNYPLDWGPATQVLAVQGNGEPAEEQRVVNISTRGKVLTGQAIMNAGFVIDGNANMDVVIRAAGPALGVAPFNLSGVLADTTIEVFQSTESGQVLVATNDNWEDNGQSASLSEAFDLIGAFQFGSSSLDSALMLNLAPGGYSAKIRGANATEGLAIVEVYDKSFFENPTRDTKLKNISTRAHVGAGIEALIPGFVVQNQDQVVLIRAVGPTLGSFGISGTLDDPRIEVKDSSQTIVDINDDWEDGGNATDITSTGNTVGAFPLLEGSKDAAIILSLAKGTYTIKALGVDGATGIALLEVYMVD